MDHCRILGRRVANLLHPAAHADPDVRARQENFILRRLASALAAAAAAPIYLAIEGAPTLAEALVFFWLVIPLGAVAFLSATGRLLAAEAFAAFCLIAAAATAAVASENPAALAWLLLAPAEAMFSLNICLIAAAGGLGAALIVALAAAELLGFSGLPGAMAQAGFLHVGLFIVPALGFATLAAICSARSRAAGAASERLQAERVRSLIEAAGELVVTHNRAGAATYVSDNCRSLFGLPASALIGRGFFERVHVADRPAFLKAVADASRCASPAATLMRLRGGGEVDRGAYVAPVFHWLEMRASRWDAGNGAKDAGSGGGAIAVFRDVTAAKQREDELEAARAAAEAASLSKDQFLANMSHELRTPLNAIIGFSEMLGDARLAPRDPSKQREYATIIQQAGQHLLGVANSILDLSKIRSGAFEVTPEAFTIAPLIDSCCDLVKLSAQENRIEIVRAYPEELGEFIGDRQAYKQILINLLSNAVKFTPAPGYVSVVARREVASVVIQVADTGVGISAHDLGRLGDPFFQVKSSLDRPFTGTGLGLSIVRGLVGLHGGAIAVASEPGQGTCVAIRLPIDCRRAAGKSRPWAEIETIPRFRRGDEERDIFQKIMGMKIA
ncbi:PAS domain-containing sensor histidine kinase [Methylocapsa acidiphila]|uniref:PAS domain-containing sensor histidine kinase n=1 Tax=Methylocapsa acidiphila TaxID=133552 RepID=UPI0003FA6A61|nr:ATP-binding protein [Methylocapsa acidiphila]